MPPKRIGRYQILDTLGGGGMGVVYLALDTTFDRQVAVKVLPSNLCVDRENRDRFRREAKSIAMLEHTAVVPVYDYGEEGDQPYLVMRYMQGGSLKDRLTRGRIPLENAAAILRQISSALDKAHSMGIIHRDIKPGNILFDLENHPYIADFGLAKLMEASTQLSHSDFFGTPAYTSPEQCQGEKNLDGRSDVYSLTAMFFHMVTGSPPYQAGNPMALMMKHISDPIPRLADLFDRLPGALQEVVEYGMAKSPVDRYPSAGEFSKAVDRILATQKPALDADGEFPGITERGLPIPPFAESSPPASFELLRKKPPSPIPPTVEQPTRKDVSPPKKPAAQLKADAVTAVPEVVPQVPRRRLEWKPLTDTAPPASSKDNVPSATPEQPGTTAQPLYSAPPGLVRSNKLAGVPVLMLILLMLCIGVIYVLWQRGIINFSIH